MYYMHIYIKYAKYAQYAFLYYICKNMHFGGQYAYFDEINIYTYAFFRPCTASDNKALASFRKQCVIRVLCDVGP